METIYSTYLSSPLGELEICGNEKGVTSVLFENQNRKFEKTASKPEIPDCLKDCVLQLEEYFGGKRKEFSLKLNPQGTDFQQKVWKELLNIPFGKTLSYLSLAKKIGDVKTIRAVGSANGRNKISIIIPCHRVIGSDGSLTGYGGELWRKKWLLNFENPVKDLFQL